MCTDVPSTASVTQDTWRLQSGSTAKDRGGRELLYVPGVFLQGSLDLPSG